MPRLRPDTQRARRDHILDAAERRFAQSGFHATSMQDICREARVSPGALYVYFASKEDLIAGLAERNRQEFQARFAQLAGASDFFAALAAIGEAYFVEDEVHCRILCTEIGLESTRNARVGEIHRSVDEFVRTSFEQLFQRMIDEGRIRPNHSAAALARVFMVIGDGLFWRSAVDRNFDMAKTIPDVVEVIRQLLNPVEQTALRRPVGPTLEEAAE
ncbi:MAG: TetR/AcrR family transcriptional regulator [Hyphomicrobium sp.]|nr:TetR/AcrR family transcriptional regulator [Hyphomicrobium sp.]